MPLRAIWWTPCQWQSVTTFASAAASSILHKSTGQNLPRLHRASKRRYFYGLRVHLVVSGAGEPVDALAAASEADIAVFKEMRLELAEGSIIYGDKAYTDYHYEDLLEEVGLDLKAQRKKRSKRPMPA